MLPQDSAILYICKRNESKDSNVIIAALFTIVKRWKQPRFYGLKA